MIVDEETDNKVVVSCKTDWQLTDGNGLVLGKQTANQSVTAYYKNDLYYFDQGTGVESTSSFLRFVPVTTEGVCQIKNFDKRKTRRGAYAENQFRNILELRYNAKKDRTWMINELGMESYLYGLGETSEFSPMEFKKALVTAARTYTSINGACNKT